VTLDEFIAEGRERMRQGKHPPRSAFVEEPEFTELYVRWSYRALPGVATVCLDLARVEAKEPGRGAFSRLIERLRRSYPWLTIYVESVGPPEFARKLRTIGFIPRSNCHNDFYLLGGQPS
jgi:hypothetical protein